MRWIRFPLAATLLLIVAGCAARPGVSPPIAPSVSDRDDLGRPLRFAHVPQRIVTWGPGATEMVFALGLGSKVVGRDSGSNYPPAALAVPAVGDFRGPAFEKVMALRPDFIVAQGETLDAGRMADWEAKCGAPVGALTEATVDGVANDFEKLGGWLGAAVAARREAAVLREARTPKMGVTAFFELGRSPLYTAGSGTLIDDVMARAGIANVARDVHGYNLYNPESLAAREPDLYIVTDEYGSTARALAELRSSPTLGQLRCVRAGKVVALPADLVLRPGPRLARGIAVLAAAARSSR